MRWCAIVVVLVGCAADDGPRLVSVTPAAGRAGDTVVIAGERLCPTDCPPAGYASFGIDPQIDAAVLSWTDTEIEAIVPSEPPGDVLIVVTVDGRSSNGLSFTVQ